MHTNTNVHVYYYSGTEEFHLEQTQQLLDKYYTLPFFHYTQNHTLYIHRETSLNDTLYKGQRTQ